MLSSNIRYILSVLICVFWLCIGNNAFAQIVVNDPEANTLKKVSLKIQAIEKATATATRTLTSAMSGDMAGVLENISAQTKSLQNLSNAFKNSAVVIRQAERVTRISREITNVGKSIDRVNSLSDETLKDRLVRTQATLREIRLKLDHINNVMKIVMDTENLMTQAERLEKIEENDELMSQMLEDLRALNAAYELAMEERNNRSTQIAMLFPPVTGDSEVNSSADPDRATLIEAERNFVSNLGEGIRTASFIGTGKKLYKRYSNYIDLLIVIIICAVSITVLNSNKAITSYDRLKAIVFTIFGFQVFKIITSYLIGI